MTTTQFNMVMARLDKIEKQISGETLPELLDTMQTAKFLGVSKRTLETRMKEPNFPTVIKVGRFNKFKKTDLINYVNNQMVDTTTNMVLLSH